MLQCRSVVRATPETWESAVATAREQVAFAHTLPTTRIYEIYLDAERLELVQLAAYDDVTAWLAHSRSNPHAQRYMTLVELTALEVYGESTPELDAVLAGFGQVATWTPVSSS